MPSSLRFSGGRSDGRTRRRCQQDTRRRLQHDPVATRINLPGRVTWRFGAAPICSLALALAGCGGGSTAVCGTTGAAGTGGTGGTGGAWQYTNPVIKGDWSDPGVVRVGEDYYSVRSTFGWQPGLAVAHSKDLVHWRYVGNGFPFLASIATGEVAGGIWGSELIYNPNT